MHMFRCSLDTRGAIVSLAFWPMVRTFLLRNSDLFDRYFFNAVYFLRISCRTSASIHAWLRVSLCYSQINIIIVK